MKSSPCIRRYHSYLCIQLSNEQFQRIQYLSLFVIPESIAVLGVLAWWLRRRGEGR